ncbi:MAG: hypothetical protein O8C67_13750 [Candidatus Methanoperedens sp.]|nr:hypothetical protein [Candidatus Methanoperedens sp.]
MIIEDYLNQQRRSNNRGLNEVENGHITIIQLKNNFLDNSCYLNVDGIKYKTLLNDIESLFNAVPDVNFKTTLIKHFEKLLSLDGNEFESWRNSIKFDNTIEDDLKVSYLCSLHDLELLTWTSNASHYYARNPRQDMLLYLQNYQNLVEGFFLKTINIILYAIMSPSGILELAYDNNTIRVRNYKNISEMDLNKKLLLLENKSTSKELINIAKSCNRHLRNAVAHHSFKLNETNKRIIFRVGCRFGQLQFHDFMNQAEELAEYRIILVECIHYYSMKCYFESRNLIT